MVSRSNLSGRPGPSGVLNRVMNPAKPRAPRPIAPPAETGGGLSGMVQRALAAGKEHQAAQAKPGLSGMVARSQDRATKAKSAMQPAVAGEKRGPRRQPTAREQARNTRQAIADTRGQAQSQRSGLEEMGATQEEVATSPRGVIERAAAGAGRRRLPPRQLAAQEQAEEARGALEATGEAGGTVTEAPVTEPSLNQARRSRSRSGRMYRR